MRQYARSEGNLLVEVAFREAVAAKLKLRRMDVLKVGVENTERIQLGDVMTTHLVGSDKKLNLRVTLRRRAGYGRKGQTFK